MSKNIITKEFSFISETTISQRNLTSYETKRGPIISFLNLNKRKLTENSNSTSISKISNLNSTFNVTSKYDQDYTSELSDFYLDNTSEISELCFDESFQCSKGKNTKNMNDNDSILILNNDEEINELERNFN